MTTRLLLSALVVTMWTPVPAPAQRRTGRRADRSTSRPATDHVKDLFDTYTQGKERERFFAAAGVDSVLTLAEYQAAAGKKDGFVRSYDTWQAAAVHDADKNGKLSWAEADQYREGIRKRVMKMFDKSGDGKLTGAERDEANKYLSQRLRAPRTGRPWAPGSAGGQPGRQYDTNGDGTIDQTERAAMEKARSDWQAAAEKRRREMLEKYDADGDGQISGQERRAMYQAWQDRQRAERLQRWDADKSGELDETELQAEREHQQAEFRKRMQEWTVRRHDKDGDGQLNEQEQAAADAERQRWQQVRQQAQQRMQEWQRRWDRDGDGALSDEERQAATDHARTEIERRRKEIDTDGDGRISGEETRAYLKALTEKYDADGDGQLSAEERREMIRAESRSFMPRGGPSSRGRRGGRGRRGRSAERRQPPAGEKKEDQGETGAVIIRTAP